MARRLLTAGVDLGRFRKVLIGGGPVPADLPGTATYGLTETWGGVVHAGHPLDGVDVALGHEDEILVRGLVVMRGYRSPTADADTAAAFTDPNTPGGGWLRTGDAGAFDGQGRLRVVDRLRDLVKTGGVSVAPTEVEAVLAGAPGRGRRVRGRRPRPGVGRAGGGLRGAGRPVGAAHRRRPPGFRPRPAVGGQAPPGGGAGGRPSPAPRGASPSAACSRARPALRDRADQGVVARGHGVEQALA